MANTYTLIASSTVGSSGSVAYVEFTSIPSTYTDLLVDVSIRNSGGIYDNFRVSFNGSTSNLSCRALYGSNGSVASLSDTVIYGWANGNTATSSTFGNAQIYVPNYNSSNYKSVSIDSVSENNGTNSIMAFTAGLWSSTSAITSLRITMDGTLMQYSSAYLYGISNS